MNLPARLLSQSSIIFGARILGAGAIVAAQAGIARLWGSQILGEYLLIIAAVNLFAMAMPLGFNTIGTYFSAEYRARGQGQLLWQFLLNAYGHVLLVGSAMSLLVLVIASFFGANLPLLTQYWMPGGVLAAAVALIYINGAVLVGIKRPYAGFFADGLLRPLLVIGTFLVAAVLAEPVERLGMMLWLFAIGYALVALFHLGFVIHSVKSLPVTGETGKEEAKRWWHFAAPWVLIALASGFFFDIDLIFLSGLLEKENLAIFGVNTRIFALLTFGVTAIYAVSLPDMFEAAARSNHAEFGRKVGDANLVAAGLSLVLFVGVLLGGPLLPLIFGPDFAAGSVPLSVLALALVVKSIFGPGELVLSIQQRPWASVPAVGAGLVVLVAANLIFVPLWGLLGAALSALLAYSVWSGLVWVIAFKATGINVSIFPRIGEMLHRVRLQE